MKILAQRPTHISFVAIVLLITKRERERVPKAFVIKTHSVIQIGTFLWIVNA